MNHYVIILAIISFLPTLLIASEESDPNCKTSMSKLLLSGSSEKRKIKNNLTIRLTDSDLPDAIRTNARIIAIETSKFVVCPAAEMQFYKEIKDTLSELEIAYDDDIVKSISKLVRKSCDKAEIK